jgi:hypothetical protein
VARDLQAGVHAHGAMHAHGAHLHGHEDALGAHAGEKQVARAPDWSAGSTALPPPPPDPASDGAQGTKAESHGTNAANPASHPSLGLGLPSQTSALL